MKTKGRKGGGETKLGRDREKNEEMRRNKRRGKD